MSVAALCVSIVAIVCATVALCVGLAVVIYVKNHP